MSVCGCVGRRVFVLWGVMMGVVILVLVGCGMCEGWTCGAVFVRLCVVVSGLCSCGAVLVRRCYVGSGLGACVSVVVWRGGGVSPQECIFA